MGGLDRPGHHVAFALYAASLICDANGHNLLAERLRRADPNGGADTLVALLDEADRTICGPPGTAPPGTSRLRQGSAKIVFLCAASTCSGVRLAKPAGDVEDTWKSSTVAIAKVLAASPTGRGDLFIRLVAGHAPPFDALQAALAL